MAALMTNGAAAPAAGLHHITAIAGDAQANHDFYTAALGLRLVKKTVNFDDPGAYHLYYGDRLGSPGTALTFFPFPGVPKGALGRGQAVLTQFSVPPGSLDFWTERLRAFGAPIRVRESVFGEERLVSEDPDGAPFALVGAADDPRAGGETLWTTDEIGAAHAIRGFHGVTLALKNAAATALILTEGLSYRREAEEPAIVGDEPAKLIRFRGEGPGAIVDLLEAPGLAPGREGAGSIHHVAFRAAGREAQEEIRARLAALGQLATGRIDRNYFWSIYFRTPGGVLFEIATDEPGFTVDEPEGALGTDLKLPPQYEPARARIEAALPALATAGG